MHASGNHLFLVQRFRRAAVLAWVACGLALCQPATAARQTTKGQDFWLAFLNNYTGDAALSVIVSSDVNAGFTVSVPGLGFSESSNVTAGASMTITVPPAAMLTAADGNANLGVHVTADHPISVYALNNISFTVDGTIVFPTEALGYAYRVMSYPGVAEVGAYGSEMAILAVEDMTAVTITLPVTVGVHSAGLPFSIILNRGEARQLRAAGDPTPDLTGALVVSDKPVAVFGGAGLARVPAYCESADHLFQQMPPLSTWGRLHVTVPLAGRENGDTFRFLAAEDGTDIWIDDVHAATLDGGQVYENILEAPSKVESDKPILVMQFANGLEFDSMTGDPFMMLIPPCEQFLTNYLVATPASEFEANYLGIVAPSSVVSQLSVDGVSVNPSNFFPIGSSPYVGGSVMVEPGAHRIKAPLPIGVNVYGFNDYESYGYAGGMALSPVVAVDSLVMTPEASSNTTGQAVAFLARLLDSSDAPVPGVRVDFHVTGAHVVTGYDVSDAEGYAHFTYTGSAGGQDAVVASVGLLTNQSVVTWTPVRAVANVAPWIQIKPVGWRTEPGTGALLVDYRLKFLAGGPKTNLRAPFRMALAKTAKWSLQRKDGRTADGKPYTDVTAQVKARLLAKYGRKVMRPGDGVVVTLGIFSPKSDIPLTVGFYAY